MKTIAKIHSPFKEKFSVIFNCECESDLKEKITQVLSLDPRPRFHEDGYKQYGSKIFNVDVHWEVIDQIVRVKKLT